MQQQIFQYAALLPRQRKGLTVHRGNAAAGVEAEPPAAQADILLDELAPGQAAHPGLQLCKVEGLGKTNRFAPASSPSTLSAISLRADKISTQVSRSCCRSCAVPASRPPWQVEVQQHKVVPLCRQCFQRGFAICTSVHLVPGQPQLPGNVPPAGSARPLPPKDASCVPPFPYYCVFSSL